jgi:predicted transposase YbfD/YdcC
MFSSCPATILDLHGDGTMTQTATPMTQTATPHTSPREIASYFDGLDDPRSAVNRRYTLSNVLAIAIMAILAGAKGPTGIARWARLKKAFLGTCLDLPDGAPRKDVFRTVLSRLRPQAFQACFAHWLASLQQDAQAAKEITQPILAVDGKTNRRSHDGTKGLGALHAVTIWASELGLSLAQVACAEKSNEITAIPEALQLVDIRGAIITIDAMGTQKEIARQIIDQEADYVFALKGNHETLHNEVVDYIDQHLDNDFADVNARRHTESEISHGREESRVYIQFPVPAAVTQKAEWKGLQTIGMATRCYTKNGEDYSEVRYYLSSLPLGVKNFARAVRQHWGVENGCHWVLDMTFREDESRIRGPQIRENVAWLNRLALSLLKQHPEKNSLAMKRQTCAWDDDYLLQVLTGIIP